MRIVHLDARAVSVSGTVAIFGMIIRGSPLFRALFGDPSRNVNHRTEIELYHASLPTEIKATKAAFPLIPNRAFPVLA
jgi:hypothetical protein